MAHTFIFLGDNANPYRAVFEKVYLKSEEIAHMEWSAYSSDLNTIENLYDTNVPAVCNYFPLSAIYIHLKLVYNQ